jgi:hypothetical protein
LKPYLDACKTTLTAATCLRNFPSQTVERHNKPEVEIRSVPFSPPPKGFSFFYRGNKELLLQPMTISRTENERCLIEPSINSVRVSIKIKQADEIEIILCRKFTAFLMQRAEQFIIMRRKPTQVRLYSHPCTLSDHNSFVRDMISVSSSLMFIWKECGNISLLISLFRSLSSSPLTLSPSPLLVYGRY